MIEIGVLKNGRLSTLNNRSSSINNVQSSYVNFRQFLVSVYIYMSSKKNVIERTRDLIYLKFVATDFSPKIISHSTGENSGDSA